MWKTIKIILELDNPDTADVVKDSPLKGFNLGAALSYGFGSETFESAPIGFTGVLSTPFGFNIGTLKYNVSLSVGSYNTTTKDINDMDKDLSISFVGLGGNLTLLEFVFAEGHIGILGDGFGFRGFSGVSLERILKKGLNLPINILLGSELFYGTEAAGEKNSAGWLSIGARLDYNF